MSHEGGKSRGPAFGKLCGIPAYALGVVALILIVFGWVSTNFLTKEILRHYEKPFLMTWLNVLTFQLYFVFLAAGDPLAIWLRRQKALKHPDPEGTARTEETNLYAGTDMEMQEIGDLSKNSHTSLEDNCTLPPLTTAQIAKIGLVFFILYFASNYMTTLAFAKTSVGSASIIASTCGFFTLIFGCMVGVEELSFMRLVAVLISVGGVLVLGKSEFSVEGTRTLGNMLSLAGAAFYGVYSVFLKHITKDETRVSMPILFAFAGLYTMLLLWPFLLIFHKVGMETLELPPSSTTWWFILINMFLGAFLPNYLWNVAFVFTSPLVVAIGISFNTPLTLLGEYLIEGKVPDVYKILSAACVIVGFIVVNLATIFPRMDITWTQIRRRLCDRDPDRAG